MIQGVTVQCPGCGETIDLSVDTTGGREQRYVEDCPVCCRPAEIRVACRDGEVLSVEIVPA